MRKFLFFYSTFIGLIMIQCSCASLPKESRSLEKIPLTKELSLIKGSYKVPNSDILWIYESLVWPEYSFLKSNKSANYLIKINEISKKAIAISLIENEVEILTKEFKYKLKEGKYVYLKNKNVKRHNVPFILGGLDTNRIQFALSKKNNLIVDRSNEGAGAFMFFIWSGTPNFEYSKIYNRID